MVIDDTSRRIRRLRLDRRTAVKGAGGLALAGAGLPFARLSMAQDAPAELPQGGTLKVAIVGEPPAVVDAMFTTATVTNNVASQMFEGLFAFDAQFNPQPMLAQDFDATADGLSFTFRLRSGVTYHDGAPLTSADVVASLNRWGAINGRGKLIYQRLAAIEAPDPSTVTMTFNEPTGILPSFLARSEAFILPASIADAAGENQLSPEQFIGTGPFRFVEHQVDRFLRMERYDGYVPREEEPNAFAGRKVAYLDAIEFIPVPDESVRANGVITGEYHFGDPLPPDFYDMLASDPSLTVHITKPYYWYSPHFNKDRGLFTDQRMRHAVQLAFSQSEAMVAGFGRQELIRFDPSVCGEETAWYSTAGAEAYDKPDPDRARALLREAGYAGETVRWLATREYAYNFKMADFIKQQLEAIGMTVELVVSDWATLIQNRADPAAYEIFLTGHSQYSHPATQPFNDPAWPGFWESDRKNEIVNQMLAETDAERLQAVIDSYTQLIWDEMPMVKLGDNFVLRATRQEVKGYQNSPDWYFWNVGLE